MLTMTQHARTRLQQRGIPQAALENLLDFGSEVHDHRGCRIVYFDRHARAQLRAACGKNTYKRLETYLDAYAVVGDSGEVVTVGHRTRHIRHH